MFALMKQRLVHFYIDSACFISVRILASCTILQRLICPISASIISLHMYLHSYYPSSIDDANSLVILQFLKLAESDCSVKRI